MSAPPAVRSPVGGATWIVLAETLMLPTGLLTVAYLTRQIGAEGYGLFTLAATLISWIEWGINSIFSRSTVKFVSEAEDWLPVGTAVLRAQFLTSILAAGVLALAAPEIATLLHEPRLSTYLWLFALEIPLFNLAQAHQNILVGRGDYSTRALASAGRWIGRLVLIVVLVELGFSITGAILGSVAAMLIDLTVSRLQIRPSLLRASAFPVAQLRQYAVPLFLSSLSLQLYEKVDLFALKALGGTTQDTGIYATAQNLSLIAGLVTVGVVPVLIATISRLLSQGDLDHVRQISRKALQIGCWALPFAGLAAGSSPGIVQWLFGAEFREAAPVFALLIFGAAARIVLSIASSIVIASGKPNWTVVLTGPLLAVATLGHGLLIPRWGAVGAAASTGGAAWLGAIAGVIAVYRLWQILPPLKTLGRCAIACGVVMGLAQVWPAPGFWLLLKLPLLSVLIGLTLGVLGEFTSAEFGLVRSMISKKLKL